MCSPEPRPKPRRTTGGAGDEAVCEGLRVEGAAARHSRVLWAEARSQKLFLDPKTFPGFDFSKRFLAKQWKVVEAAWDDAYGAPGKACGFTAGSGGDIYVVLPKWDSRVFVHEAYHAVQAVLRIIGTQDDELGAYLVEWLFEEVCWPGGGKSR